MAVTTTGKSRGPAGAGWHVLLRPQWLTWHAFVAVSTAGMLLLGNWQLHRAEAGNSLSWAYTFEWPLFAGFTIFFWIKSLRDELRGHAAATAGAGDGLRATGASPGREPARAPVTGHQPASWDATSWDATSWDATSGGARPNGTDAPADIARATPADGEAYVARLLAEVQRPGRRRGER